VSVAARPISDLRPIIPRGFEGEEPRIRTGDWADRFREAAKAPVSSAPLWRITHKPRSFLMSRPLLVQVFTDEGFVFARNASLSICGTGASLEEAMADFSLHAVHFYEYYRSLPESKLVGDAIRLKKLFADLFVEE